MIRVNLGKTRIENGESFDRGGIDVSGSSEGSSQLALTMVKAALLIGGTCGLYYYESQNIARLQLQYTAVLQNVQELQGTLTQKNAELEAFGPAQKDSKVLEDKLKLLKELSHLRLREVKSLDFIQTVIPARAWLTGLQIDHEDYRINGQAQDQTAVSLLVRKLDNRSYFSDVVLVQDAPTISQGMSIRTFEIIAHSEVEN